MMRLKSARNWMLAVVAWAAMIASGIETRFNSEGNWTNAANWNNGVPGVSDVAKLQNPISALIDSAETIGGLNFRGDPSLGQSIININAGGALTSDGTQFGGDNIIGADGDATFNINTGGSANFSGTGDLKVGQSDAGDTGYVNVFEGGVLTVSQGISLGASKDALGYVVVDGGTATFNNDVSVGLSAGSTGRVALNAGVLNLSANLRITDNVSANGELRVNGGVLNALNSSLQVRDGAGAIVQTGGEINAEDIFIGHLAGSSGTMTMSGGTNTVSGVLSIGNQNKDGANGASGTVVMSGGRMIVGALEVGNEATSSGQLVLDGAHSYLKATTLSLGDAGAAVDSTVNVMDGEFQIHAIVADGDAASETIHLEGGVLKLRHVGGATGFDDAVALIAAGVLTWEKSAQGSLASTYDAAEADMSWTNGDGVTLYADTDGTNYSYMWTEAIPEPATVGLIALTGGGLLFGRRFFIF